MHTASDIALCFDKPRCQDWLAHRSVPIPGYFAEPRCYADLRRLVTNEGRLMVKLAHGSGAAGCIALHGDKGRIRAVTTVAEVIVGGERRLFHSKRPRLLAGEVEIASLVEQLAVEKLHVEEWLPKAPWEGKNFDLRLVTIGGVPRHVMVRGSSSVFTNLTLGSQRGSATGVARRMGPESWQWLRDSAAKVARAFPRSFTLGIDILVRPDWRRHAVLEVNAFGDLLLGQLDRGEDTYTATLAAWDRQQRAAEAAPP